MADLYGLLPGWGRMPPFLLYTGFGWRAMRLGLIQMDVVSGDKERNITHAFELMGKVSHQADMIVLPELWTIGYDFHNLGKNATYMGDGLIQRLSSLAAHTGTYIIAGTLPVKKGGVIRNTGLVFGKDGDIKGEYSKRHLFYGYLEAELMRPGRKLLYEDIDGVRTGMAVCYEFYFPGCGGKWRKGRHAGSSAGLVACYAYLSMGCADPCQSHRKRTLHSCRQYVRKLSGNENGRTFPLYRSFRKSTGGGGGGRICPVCGL